MPVEHQLMRKLIAPALALLCLFQLTPAVLAGSSHKHGFPSVSISNFGKVNDHFYRGAQPDGEEYSQLAALGIKTVVDLRDDPKSYARPMAERAGLHYINFPMSDTRYPQPDTAQRFLEIVNNPANWPVYVHCAGGRHRTGVMTAVYRISVDGWDIDQAYREMKDYDFYTAWGHKAMKDYIYDYYRDAKQHQAQAEGQKVEAARQ